jgi:4-amino-4-deoxy-L-arabinose transferase-like glycosyltransferase
MNDLHNNKKLVWSLLAAFTIVWLYVLGVRTLVPPDEGRYAEMAREMLASGDWITTRLNGIKYFEKPPLQTWMNALSFAVFGLGEWQARLWTGFCGWLGVVLTAYAGNKVFGGRAGLYAGLVLASSLYWVASGQFNSLDMSLSAMMAISLCALIVAQRDAATPGERRWWMLACWAGMALAVLAKGLIGVVLPGAVLVLYTLAARDWRIWTRLHLLTGLLLFFAIATPWFVLVGLKNPEQPHFFFIHEHLERFLTKEHHREGAWYYFVPLTLIGMVPWVGLLPQSLLGALRRDDGSAPGIKPANFKPTIFKPKLMLLIWAAFIFFFFSYSSSKLPGYVLPIFPALALLMAVYLETAARASRLFGAGLMALVGLAAMAAVPFMTRVQGGDAVLMQAAQPWALGAGFIALAGGALALLHARHLRRDMMVLTMACAGFLFTELVLAGFQPFSRERAGLALAPKIRAELTAETKIYSVGTYDQSLTFYLRHTVILVDYLDEFTFGLEQQPELAIKQTPTFVARWTADAAAGRPDIAIVHEDLYLDMQKHGTPLRLVVRDDRRIVIANLPAAPTAANK